MSSTFHDYTTPEQLPLFADVETAARILGIGRNTAYDAVQRGEIPTVRFGRRLRVPKAALLALAGYEVQIGGDSDAAA